MPRSIPMPRSQPMSSYLLYSSLMFHHSQAPISIATKCPSPSQPSTHLHRNQVPCPAMISVDPPVLAETLIITHRLCIISGGGNEAAAFYPFGLRTLATGSQLYWKDHSPSSVPLYFSSLLLTCPCFNTPDPHHPVYLTLGHVIFPVRIIIHP